MVKAIIFDCFGVLASDGWLPFRDRHFAHNPALLAKAMQYNNDINAGVINYNDFIDRVAALANISQQAALKEIENNIPDTELLTFIAKHLKPHYRVGMLSNAGDNWLREIFLPEQVNIFDAIVLSYETGIIKPNTAAYQIIADKLDVNTNECVFIDDQPAYCRGALQAGMHAIRYSSLAQMKQELKLLTYPGKN